MHETQRTLNLGILAHVDAGKTSLTERLLHSAGVIDEIGSVDDGNTQTDSLALERRRGITIKSAVVSFALDDDTTVNLIDTPGHPDFIAEVERVLSVLDGAVLVVSAVEGVQAQTRILMRTLRRLRIPVLIFVNKVDRAGARPEHVLREIAAKLTPAVVPTGEVTAPGTRAATVRPYEPDDPRFTARLVETLAEHDDEILAAYVDDARPLPPARLHTALRAQTARAQAHLVYFGSAITGAGVPALIHGVRELLPAATGDPDGPLSGTVFKVERGPAGEKIGYVRLFSGTVRVRDVLTFGSAGRTAEGKVTGIAVFDRGAAGRADEVTAGRIGKLWGLGDLRIGDSVGVPPEGAAQHHFAPPTLETVVVPATPADRGPLHLALTRLAEQDPLIDLRQDDVRGEVSVSLYGEVQKEVVQATLAEQFGVDVTFRETTTICVERPVGTGHGYEKDLDPFLGTVGLRVEPAPVGSGIRFRLEVELGSMPYAFFKAVEETVGETLREGLHGWQVADCTVTMTHSGYWPRQSHSHAVFDKSMSSTARDFRQLTPLVLMSALQEAGTRVHEPMHRFRIEAPDDTSAPLLSTLARLGAVPREQRQHGAEWTVEGDVPAAHVHALEQRLPGLTRGEGVLETSFSHYAPTRTTPPPTRPRTDQDPLNRKEYLLRVARRVR
ncbi:elongation factor G [Streptomyces cavernicola]|uniref:TetM/TetW/TetO/TetS family tetracycline resistance ribosomal protection protein n=1 Tax=Streptomyces cavernicola TaxID=3043613 RepID=A0ABT6S2C3_9ACTN|nr:TetM/TetW/TetO/TetS family tetracycline resistance ribosomal protection protein [Streptomyces sp. B-S-A6]MDI3402256.1 TetM/TetW/TetO/TetS family tetracycline resistance ribosomal protection protein [Streptomyces sp. B-S-A6]